MSLTYQTPPQDEIYAMDSSGYGNIKIEFTDTTTGTAGIHLKNSVSGTVIPVDCVKDGNNYTAIFQLPKGRYEYYFTDSLTASPAPPVPYRLKVGRLFVIVGHSLASPLGVFGITDDRVWLLDKYQAKTDSAWKNLAKYTATAFENADDIYNAAVTANAIDLYDNYQCGAFAEMARLIAVRDDIVVGIINCGMGGSSMQMWADQAAQIPFTHGFAATVSGVPDYNLYNSGFPYNHFENVIKSFGKKYGVSAVLIQHGENDDASDINKLAGYYSTMINTCRVNAQKAKLPFIIAKSDWLNSAGVSNKLAAIDKVLATVDYTYFGVDTHLLAQTYRGQPSNPTDGHWNVAGGREVGRMWSERLTSGFLNQVQKGESTLVATPVVVQNPTVTNSVNEPNLANTGTSLLKKINWTAGIIITAIVAGLFFGAKFLFNKVKFLKKISLVLGLILSVLVGGIYLSINALIVKNKEI